MTVYYYTLKRTFVVSGFFSEIWGLIFIYWFISHTPSPHLSFYSSVNLKIYLNKSWISSFLYESSYPTITTTAPVRFTATLTLHWFSQNYVGCILKQETFPPNDLIRLWWIISPGRSSKPCHQHYLNLLPFLIIFIIALSMNSS